MPQVHPSWSREQLLVALQLYCKLPFGRLHSGAPEIIETSELIGRTPGALAMKLTNIASLDPKVTSRGLTGLANASAKDREMWQEMHDDWENFVVRAELALSKFRGTTTEPTVTLRPDEELSVDYTGHDRPSQGTTRVGQDFFRSSVLSAYGQQCCITGLRETRLLIASHIKPWREDPRNRLNPKNGLCLNALHDKAFDAGFITITEAYTVNISRQITEPHNDFSLAAFERFQDQPIRLPNKFQPDEEFLAFHRESIFRG